MTLPVLPPGLMLVHGNHPESLRDLLVTWVGDGTELVLLQQDGTYALLATVPGEYTVKGSGVDVNVVPHPGDVLVVHGRDGQHGRRRFWWMELSLRAPVTQ